MQLRIGLSIGLAMTINPIIAQGRAQTPPTRDPRSPGFVTAKELPDGNVPPPSVNGNFIIGPTHPPARETIAREGVPHGTVYTFTMSSADSKIFPGIARDSGTFGTPSPTDPATLIVTTSHPAPYTRTIKVYVPEQYVPGATAPFIVGADGPDQLLFTTLDNLIAEKRVPVMIAISIGDGGGDAQGSERGLEYDTMSGRYAEFVETEVLPLVERQYNVRLTRDPEGRATMGNSSGGSAAFIMAWYRPDLYHRVLAYSITAINQQWPHSDDTPHGAWELHERLIPNNPVRPIRVWMEVGDRDFLNPNVMRDGMHDWVIASENMARALAAKGYNYQFVFARNAGHVDRAARQQTLPAALEWLWRGFVPAQNAAVSGTTFIDLNGNGIRERGERGLAGVVMSNQDAVVSTDESGQYHLSPGPHKLLFVSVPDGYRAVGSFWRHVNDTTTTVDFPLSPITRSRTFSFIHASDTHIAAAVLARTQRLRALADSINPAFVIITGDLVRDALRVGEAEATGYYEMFGREAALFKSPVWTVPGNHENFGIERGKSNVSAAHPLYGRKMYYRYRGPDYYSFTFGGVHFIGLNSVDIDDQWYYGHVDSVQLAWLERDLAMVPKAMPVVTFNHIPFFSSSEILNGYTDEPPAPTLITVNGKTTFRHTVSNAGEVLEVLRKHRHVLALGGHIHAGEHIEYNADNLTTSFNQAPAIVGPRMSAGMLFPSGFTLYTVRNGQIDAGRFISLGIEAKK